MLHLDTTPQHGCTGKWIEDYPVCSTDDRTTTREERAR